MSLRPRLSARIPAVIAALACAPMAAGASPDPLTATRPSIAVWPAGGRPATPPQSATVGAPAKPLSAERAGRARQAAAPSVGAGGEGRAGRPVRRRSDTRPALARPLAALQRANAEARDGPASGVFVNSALYHPFEPGRLYAIHASPRFLTAIALRPGERLIAKAAGDTVRWVLGETEAGAGETRQVIVLVKPMRSGLRTNLVLTTDQRTYLIDAISTDTSAYTSVLSWTYPSQEAAARGGDPARRAEPADSAAAAQASVSVERLDFRYAIAPIKGKAPPWTPVRVFDDGAKTYVEFPPDLAVREAPPLFLLDADGQAQPVNVRFAGRYLVVDRLVERAELRLGDKRPAIVRLTRLGPRR